MTGDPAANDHDGAPDESSESERQPVASDGDRQTTGDVSEQLLVEVAKRAPLLDLLREGPREVNEMVERLDMSRSTIHRTTRSLTEKGLLRNGDACQLTGFGRTVAEEVAHFRARIAGAAKLRAFLNTAHGDDANSNRSEPNHVGPDGPDVPVEKFADATVSRPKPRQPHFAVKRIIELMERAESVQIFSGIISPFYVDAAYRQMRNGTEIEVVFDPEVVEIVAEEYTEKARKAAETGQFEILVHENVPFELFVFDDRAGIAAHDDGGIAQVFVEVDAPTAVTWAENVYEDYRERATHVDLDAF